MVSAIDARGIVRFLVGEAAFNAELFTEFWDRLIAGRQKPVFAILDGHLAQKAKNVKELVTEHSEMIELYTCPAIRRDGILTVKWGST